MNLTLAPPPFLAAVAVVALFVVARKRRAAKRTAAVARGSEDSYKAGDKPGDLPGLVNLTDTLIPGERRAGNRQNGGPPAAAVATAAANAAAGAAGAPTAPASPAILTLPHIGAAAGSNSNWPAVNVPPADLPADYQTMLERQVQRF